MTLAELRELEKAATPGMCSVIEVSPEANYQIGVRNSEDAPSYAGEQIAIAMLVSSWDGAPRRSQIRPNAELFAAARNALPALLDFVEAFTKWRDCRCHRCACGQDMACDLLRDVLAARQRIGGGA